jgi:Ca2+ transporting ATPase
MTPQGSQLFVKGASEIVLECCDTFQPFDGPAVPITPEIKKNIEEAIASMANLALRTIIIAKKIVENQSFADKDDKGVF